jgi:hypothetical protein
LVKLKVIWIFATQTTSQKKMIKYAVFIACVTAAVAQITIDSLDDRICYRWQYPLAPIFPEFKNVISTVIPTSDNNGFTFRLARIPYMDNAMFAISDHPILSNERPTKREPDDISSGTDCYYMTSHLICPNSPQIFKDYRYKCTLSSYDNCRTYDCEWYVSRKEADQDIHVEKTKRGEVLHYKFNMYVGYYIPNNLVGPASMHEQQTLLTFNTEQSHFPNTWIWALFATGLFALALVTIVATVALHRYREIRKRDRIRIQYQNLV